jgi:uncharacterized membrane protein YvbJ
MQCRNCGAEIADKALICYRCGTATTEAKYKPVQQRARRSRVAPLVITVLIIAIILLIVWYVANRSGARTGQSPVSSARPAATVDGRLRLSTGDYRLATGDW